jgi:hypothetical protein
MHHILDSSPQQDKHIYPSSINQGGCRMHLPFNLNNMFKKCIIKSVLIEAQQKKVSLAVVQRFLAIYYDINVSMSVLVRRKTWIKITNQ